MRPALLALLIPLAACDDHIYPAVGDGGTISYTSDWTGVQEFMGDHCEGCHPSLARPSMPDGIAADIIDGNTNYVVPFEPENSEFWLVIVDQSEETALMPLGSAQPLPDDVIQPVFDWIAAGASLN